jgi:hypothetical protein
MGMLLLNFEFAPTVTSAEVVNNPSKMLSLAGRA